LDLSPQLSQYGRQALQQTIKDIIIFRLPFSSSLQDFKMEEAVRVISKTIDNGTNPQTLKAKGQNSPAYWMSLLESQKTRKKGCVLLAKAAIDRCKIRSVRIAAAALNATRSTLRDRARGNTFERGL
jgi:hypothetical protein